MMRLSVNINDSTEAALRELASQEGQTITEIVRKALGAYQFFTTQKAQGRRILIDDHGTVMEVMWL